MSGEVGKRFEASRRSAGSALRPLGRVAIWAVIALLLVRGLGAVLAPEGVSRSAPVRSEGVDPASASLAVRFARAYLADPAPRELAPFLAEGARVGRGRSALAGDAALIQAEVAATQELGGGREILTVACDLRDGRSLYLAVPISRSRAGEVAVSGAPWVVAEPSTAGVEGERPRPLAGEDAGAIRALAAKFLPAYLADRSARDLSYLLAPGASVAPLGGALEPFGSGGSVAQLGDGEGHRRTVVVSGRFRDPASGAVYQLAYRLELVKRNRWYVRSVEGALS
ncbi:MAG: conjugal transfer protein [Chloroflexota bacterium]